MEVEKNTIDAMEKLILILICGDGTVQAVWDMLADKKIWALLEDLRRKIDEDTSRLLFIELFSRLKAVEEEVTTLKVLLLEEQILNEEVYSAAKQAVREFFRRKDNRKAAESDFFAQSGIPFKEWVNFKLNGKFVDEDDSSS